MINHPRTYERTDEDQLYVDATPYRPRLKKSPGVKAGKEMIPADSVSEHLKRLPTRLDVWRAALLGTLTGAAIVIGWIER